MDCGSAFYRISRSLFDLHVAELATVGSRDSLLVAMTTLMWGSADAELVQLVRRLVYDAMTQSQQVTDILILKRVINTR